MINRTYQSNITKKQTPQSTVRLSAEEPPAMFHLSDHQILTAEHRSLITNQLQDGELNEQAQNGCDLSI